MLKDLIGTEVLRALLKTMAPASGAMLACCERTGELLATEVAVPYCRKLYGTAPDRCEEAHQALAVKLRGAKGLVVDVCPGRVKMALQPIRYQGTVVGGLVGAVELPPPGDHLLAEVAGHYRVAVADLAGLLPLDDTGAQGAGERLLVSLAGLLETLLTRLSQVEALSSPLIRGLEEKLNAVVTYADFAAEADRIEEARQALQVVMEAGEAAAEMLRQLAGTPGGVAEAPEPPGETARGETGPEAVPYRILVIDDTPGILKIMDRSLAAQGYLVKALERSREALAAAREFRPDLLVLDYRMPGENGLQVLARLREAGLAVPALLVTAYGTPQVAAEAGTLGVRGLVAKPFTLPVFLRAVAGILPEKAARVASGLWELATLTSAPASLRLLVVDDGWLTEEMLRRFPGVEQVKKVRTTEEAQAALREGDYSLLLVDGGITGVAALCRWAALRAPALPQVVMEGAVAFRLPGQEAGPGGRLRIRKPLRVEQLRKILHRLETGGGLHDEEEKHG